ncbi:MAG TPA: carboxylating nicotinate-nucleotide diphosphorylase [Gemmatimonadaceae bacterium]|nr:carboxylating nicotinate-nucleotide diphosphorylase [Gemmatimonadaceae bacterium]
MTGMAMGSGGWEGRERRRTPRTITPESAAAAEPVIDPHFPLSNGELRRVVREALDEDNAFNDLTTAATVVSDRHARGRLVAREPGVVAGVPLAVEAFRQLDPKVTIRIDAEDGTRVAPGTTVLFLSGHARGLLSAERVALNFLQRLSGVASYTRRFVDAVQGTGARIYDTRKTTPGWRKLERYAVRAGGGVNHRFDLASAVLVKDNHLAALDGDIRLAVQRARELSPPGTEIEIECETREQVEAAVAAGADIVLLDNMEPALMAECVRLAKGRAITEASGGVTLHTARRIAETGVDRISVGALTHSPPALDLALDLD